MAQLYTHPEDYDLEHLGESEDVEFYVNLAKRLRPKRILELACGTGRVTLALAEAGFEVVGLDSEHEMLSKAIEKRGALSSTLQERLEFLEGDMLTWSDKALFDLILIPCGSITHILELEDQLTTWRNAFANLSPGGRLVIDTTMPNFAAYADSLATPQRSVVELDRDIIDDQTGIRLLRQKTTNYIAESQRAKILFLFEKIAEGRSVERYVDDFESHVYFPRELQLLFLCAGFEVEAIYGDFKGKQLKTRSPAIIMMGRKPD